MPQLRQTVLLPDLEAEVDEGEIPPLVAHSITDHPEIARAYERYRLNWETWSAEYRRHERVQIVYAELFRMHTQVRKQGEIVELVLCLAPHFKTLQSPQIPFSDGSVPKGLFAAIKVADLPSLRRAADNRYSLYAWRID